jgi:hypothetical protein
LDNQFRQRLLDLMAQATHRIASLEDTLQLYQLVLHDIAAEDRCECNSSAIARQVLKWAW